MDCKEKVKKIITVYLVKCIVQIKGIQVSTVRKLKIESQHISPISPDIRSSLYIIQLPFGLVFYLLL